MSNLHAVSGLTLPWPDQAPGGLGLDDAIVWCREFASDHVDRLPGIGRLLAGPLGADAAVVFAFVQRVHEFARAPQHAGERIECIAAWEALLLAAYHGEASHPIFVALRDTVRRLDLPIGEFIEVLDAHRTDIVRCRYATWSELERFGESASRPLGRLTWRLLNYRGPRLLQLVDALSLGLWMVDMLWDIDDDLARDRLYVPLEDLLLFGVEERELLDQESPRAHALLDFECTRARMLLLRGRSLLLEAPPEAATALSAIWLSAFNRLETLQRQSLRSGSANQ